jgi:uncharacterized membrane protein YfhO
MKNWQAVCILLIIVLLYFAPAFLDGGYIIFGDNMFMHYPMKVLTFDILKNGEFPFWNPYILSGTPLFASMQVGVFYPLNWLFFALPPATAFSIEIIITFIIAGTGMYLYLKEINKNNFASLFGAITFTFSSYLILKMENLPIIQEISLIPFILLLLEKGKKSTGNTYILIAGILFGLSLLAGHPQIAFYTAIIIIIYQLYFFCIQYKKDKPFHLLLNTLIVILTGFLIAAVQILPTLQLALESCRLDLNTEKLFTGSSMILNLITLCFPFYFGSLINNGLYDAGLINQPHDLGNYCIYAGILPLIFFIIAIIKDYKNEYIRIWLIIGLTGLVLSLGKFFILSELIYSMPVFNLFRYPGRYLLMFNLALCIISSYGIIKFFDSDKKEFFKCFKFIIISLFLFILLAFGYSLKGFSQIVPLFSANNVIPVVVIIVSLITLVCAYFFKGFKAKALLTAVLLADLVVLFAFYSSYKPYYKELSLLIKEKPPAADYLERNLNENERFISIFKETPENLDDFYRVIPDYSVLFKLHTITGYEVLILKRYSIILNTLIENVPPFLKFNSTTYLDELLGCRYFILRNEKIKDYEQSTEFNKNWKKTTEISNLSIYRNDFTLPKVLLVRNYRIFENDRQAIEFIQDKNQHSLSPWNPARTALIARQFAGNIPFEPDNSTFDAQAKINNYSYNKVSIKVKTPEAAVLILNDNWYPFWKGYINSKESPVFPVNITLRGIVVPEGESLIEFKIMDTYFIYGLIISIISIILLTVLIIHKKNPA